MNTDELKNQTQKVVTAATGVSVARTLNLQTCVCQKSA